MLLKKNITGWIVLQYKIIITKYSYYIAFPSNTSMRTRL